ncbi:zinc ribbon domain-containing protein [Methylocella sp. CPCC 101449]|uniref:zinc ribbon domain-containing protein n=1 Tax=Methylocella sp. CPCC 101449 TaxID=2987531 RepID=UPI00288D588C|nr:zinc ribbon domain-containing protein [Methylocella sp. CPCC 101449]MDT2024564.1 zinc ribbon domain-containing protein [Methylocella sp. CPCC 101449]
MPVYEYLCTQCGSFTEIRPMVLSADPCDCPSCGVASERAILTAPQVLGMDAARRGAFATNERSRHEPKLSGHSETAGKKHRAGCACCSGQRQSKAVFRADGGKSFPSERPWMISH